MILIHLIKRIQEQGAVVLVRKNDSSLRFCVIFKKLCRFVSDSACEFVHTKKYLDFRPCSTREYFTCIRVYFYIYFSFVRTIKE